MKILDVELCSRGDKPMTNRCKLELQIANHLEQHLARTEAPSLALTRVARARPDADDARPRVPDWGR